ncbi:MAG: hypothetical protein JRI48_10425 [Deltaproteobacteria bacterium]|nr:hypothetical protein [Deltaproteobacteria bacterium]
MVEYYQLAHNERHPVTRKPVAKIIYNFGRSDKLDRDQLVRLCQSIARVCGLTVVDPFGQQQGELFAAEPGLPRDLKIVDTVSFGTVLAIETLWERLGLKKTFSDIIKRERRQ